MQRRSSRGRPGFHLLAASVCHNQHVSVCHNQPEPYFTPWVRVPVFATVLKNKTKIVDQKRTAGTVPATPTHPVPSPHIRHPPAADSPPNTSTAPPHRAYPARQRHQTRANPTNLAAPSTVHHPLPPKPPPSDAHPLRAVPPRRPPPSTPPPALSPSEQTQIDHSDRPCPRQPHLSPLVCVVHTMRYISGAMQFSRG